jgi:ornithine cyclodeaminase/alanine dehydrogenase-like protein (mu-crystallin family)
MLVLTATDVRAAFPMGDAVGLMRSAMAAHGRGEVFQPPRVVLDPPAFEGSVWLKPASVEGGVGLKVLTIVPGNRQRGLEVIQAFVALVDPETGVLLALLEGGVVTELRTAATSGAATDLLANPDAGDLAIIGAGVQARSHLLAMAEVRKLRRVRVWNRTESRALEFVRWADARGFEVEVCDSVQSAVDGADLVCSVTSSTDPLIDGDWISPGTHHNAVGAFHREGRELCTNLVRKVDVFAVDSREGAFANAGDMLIPLDEGALDGSFDPPEVGELLVGTRAGRTDKDQITVFESLGLAIQDVAAAASIVARAQREGIGVVIDFP